MLNQITKFRHLLLTLILIILLMNYRQLGLSPITLSFKSINFNFLFYYCLVPSVLLSILIAIIYQKKPILLTATTKIIHFPKLSLYFPLFGYPLISVPLQEIVFRWFLLNLFLIISHEMFISIILSSLIFGLLHLSFSKLLVISTFIISFYWSFLYLSTNNLWYPIISHGIVGNTLIWLTLFHPLRTRPLISKPSV